MTRVTPRSRPARLAVIRLEDRTVPSGLRTDPASFAPDRILVSYADAANHAAALAAVPTSAAVAPLGLGTYAVTLVAGVSPLAAVSIYAGQPGVVAAGPDYVITADRTPNDPSFTTQWGLNNTGQSGGVADADVDGPEAWDVQTGTRNTVVAVIDSGVDYTHPDLAANMWVNPGEVPGDGIDNNADGFVDDVHGYDFVNRDGNPADDNGHGTHVAGTIGAVGDNSVGVAGVVWNTRIMALKFLGASGSGSTSNAIAALNYAVAHGASISNNSWGGGGASSSLSAAIANARSAGHIFVAAAGNAGANNDAAAYYPGNYVAQHDNVVTVAAVDRTGTLASFSNYGANNVTLAAPGVSVLSTRSGGGYVSMSGTSMATPFVAGALALLKDHHPTWTYSQLIAKLESSVDLLPNLAGRVSTGGRLNVAKILDAGTPVPPTVPPPFFVSGPKVGAAAFTGPNAASFSAVRLTFGSPVLAASFTAADVVGLTGPTGAIPVTGVTPVAGTDNTQFDVTFAPRTAAGAYTLTVGPDVIDAAGNAMNQNGNAVNGETPGDRFTATASLADGRSAFAAANLPVTIPDRATVSVPVVVNQDIRIDDLNVTFNLTHTYDSDLVITLTSPAGTTRTLVNRRGGSGDNFATTTIDDQARNSLVLGRAPFNSSYRPEQTLAAFVGQNARGTWTLRVSDVASLDTGRVNAVTLSIAGTPIGQRTLALAMGDDEVTPPIPVVTAAGPATVKFQPPVLHGVWVTPDETVDTTKTVKKPVPWTADTDSRVMRFAGRRAEFDPTA